MFNSFLESVYPAIKIFGMSSKSFIILTTDLNEREPKQITLPRTIIQNYLKVVLLTSNNIINLAMGYEPRTREGLVELRTSD